MNFSHLLVATVLLCSATTGFAQETNPSKKLAFAPGPDGTFTFDTGVVRGRVHSDGRGFGLNGVENVADGQPMSGAVGLLNVYRVFSDGTRYGNAGWEWPNQAELAADGSLTVKCAATPERPFELQGTYRWVSASRIDLELLVTPVSELKDFEVFVASYFDKAFTQSAAFVNENPQMAGKPGFMSAKQELGNWLMFPRDAKAVALIQDGRWKLAPNPVDWVIQPTFWKPLAMRRIPDSRLTALLMAKTDDTFAMAMPFETEGHYSVYFSLFGRDMKAGQKAKARVRLEVLTAPDDAAETAQKAYQEF